MEQNPLAIKIRDWNTSIISITIKFDLIYVSTTVKIAFNNGVLNRVYYIDIIITIIIGQPTHTDNFTKKRENNIRNSTAQE